VSDFPGDDSDEPSVRLSEEDRLDIFTTVANWADQRAPSDPIMAFLDGSVATAGDLARALRVYGKPTGRSLSIGHLFRAHLRSHPSDEDLRQHVLNLFAAESFVRGREVSALLEPFRMRPPEAGLGRQVEV
jgi:hypothetical protein